MIWCEHGAGDRARHLDNDRPLGRAAGQANEWDKDEDVFHRSARPYFPPEDVKCRTEETPKAAPGPRKGGRGGNNTYGNKGTRKCHRCRQLKCKARLVALQDLTFSVNMIKINQRNRAKDAAKPGQYAGPNG